MPELSLELPPPLRHRFQDRQRAESADLLALAGVRSGAGDVVAGRGSGRVDRRAAAQFVAFGYLAGVSTLAPGVGRVWESWPLAPPDPPPSALTFDERADRLWELLVAAVARACGGRTAPRTTLSGGLDSRAVAAALAKAAPAGRSAGTFGDPDCADLPVARSVAAALGLPHEVTELSEDAALVHEARVWRATGGMGGPAAAPGAATDEAWAESCDVLLSGTAGDVIWGDSVRPGPSPRRRLRRLGMTYVEPAWDEERPSAPSWLDAASPGAAAWTNLWTRQACGTWMGVQSRLPYTPVAPVLWDDPLIAFCLALGDDDRRDRALVRRMLARHAPAASTDAIPLAPRGPVHDLDRAFRGPAWAAELDRWLDVTDFRAIGLSPRGVRRLVARIRAGRNRAASLSRVRALARWSRGAPK